MGLQGKKSSYPHKNGQKGSALSMSEAVFPLALLAPAVALGKGKPASGSAECLLWLLLSPPKDGGCYHLGEMALAGSLWGNLSQHQCWDTAQQDPEYGLCSGPEQCVGWRDTEQLRPHLASVLL